MKLGIKTTLFNVTLVDDAIRISINHFWTYNLVKVNRLYTIFLINYKNMSYNKM